MLSSLDFLESGQPWPPKSELPRLEKYDKNKKLFEGNHEEVFAEQFKRIQRVIGNFQDVVSYATIVNFYKLFSVKIADLLLGESPSITAGDDNSKEQDSIKNIKENSDLDNTSYQACIDLSRFGDGLFLIYKDADTKAGTIDVTQPSIWFPVVNPTNVKKIQYHVLAWKYSSIEAYESTGILDSIADKLFGTDPQRKEYLKVQIHFKGKYEERVYLLQDDYIKRLTEEPVTVNTGLSDFAVVQVPNLITSDRICGLDDYTDINSLISEIEVRVSQIAKVLDKHAEPSVTGPSSCLERDEQTGEWKLKMGNFFPRDDKEDPEVKYITWDASLEANFKFLEKLINILYTISEMGSAIFGDQSTSSTVQVPSGSALKRLMISPLAKVNRIRMRFDPALKRAVKLCSQLGGEGVIDLSKTPINITWNDGLPDDPKEEADIMAVRTGNKPTISQFKAIQSLDNLSDEDVDQEIERIDEDEAKNNPVGGGNFPFASTAVNTNGEE
jgi:hypothetical protein